MTERLDLDRRVGEWLHDSAPPRAHERILEGVLERVTAIDQERHLTQRVFGDGLGRSPRLRWGLALALVATVSLFGALVAAGALRPPSPLPSGELSDGSVAYSIDGNIHVVRDGTPDRLVIGHAGDGVDQTCPVFSPDGSSLAYVESVEFRPEAIPGNIVLTGRAAIAASGGAAVRIPFQPPPVSCPRWAPDGHRLASLQAGELTVTDLDDRTTTVRFRRDDLAPIESPDAALQEARFAWSPDGSTIAVVLGYWPGSSEVWLVPAASVNPGG